MSVPTPARDRSELLDALRGFALFGIMFVNMTWFTGWAVTRPDPAPHDLVVEWLVVFAVDSKFWTLFALMFGVGVALQAERHDRFAGLFARRMVVLFAIGAAHAVLVWFGDIVSLYAATGLLLLLFLPRSQRTILAWSIALILSPIVIGVAWMAVDLALGVEAVDPPHGPYDKLSVFAEGGLVETIRTNWDYVVMRWWRGVVSSRFTSLLGLFLLGVWITRHARAGDPARLRRLLWITLGAGLAIGLPGNLYYAAALPGLRPHAWADVPGLVLKTVGIPALALAYASAFTLAFPACRSLLRVFIPIGRMSLTNYILQSVIGVALFYGCGLGLWGQVSITWSIPIIGAIFAGLTIGSAVWLKVFRQGPLEWLWRSICYGRPLPWRAGAAGLAAALLATPAQADTLVVFLGDTSTGPDADFVAHHRENVRSLASELGVELEIRSIADGAPEEIRITPLLVYQSHRGRSVFQGRYANLPRLKNFIRTARVVAPDAALLEKSDVLAWSAGRTTVAAPLKITALGGDVPADHDDAALRERITRGLAAGMTLFERRPAVRLARADRMFYVDVHPYLGGGVLYLSCEIYSQFNCHTPVYSALDEPIVGFWDDRDALFADAGEILQNELRRLIESSSLGDAFVPVPATVPAVAWEAIGLPLPPPPADGRGASAPTDLAVSDAWKLPAPATVVFHFPSPLERYAGEARVTAAHLDLRGHGRFEADISTVTMGDDELDDALQGSLNLDTGKHPVSRFIVESIELEGGRPPFGAQARGVMHGTFELKAHRQPLTVRCTLEPIIGDDGRPRLLLHADWNIRLRRPFGLIGPDGPDPQRDTLNFDLQVVFEQETDP